MSDDDSDKTEEPTGKKIEDAKKKGQFAKTKEFSQFVVIFFGLGGLLSFGDTGAIQIRDYARNMFVWSGEYSVDTSAAMVHAFAMSVQFLWDLLGMPLFLLWLFVTVLCLAHNRFNIPEEALKLDIKKLDPINGFKEKFLSMQPIVEFSKSMLKLALLGYVVYKIINREWSMLPGLINGPPILILVKLRTVAKEIFWSCIPFIILIGIMDFAYQWYDNNKKLKMSKYDIKEESKQAEGSPEAKGEQKKKRRDILVSTLQQVERADVVVVNPTHFSVALRYRKEEADAPVVIARGVDHMAFRIRNVAGQFDIPIVENPPLARGLYYQTKEGQEIPPDFYAAVAELLALILKRRQSRIRGSASPV